MIFGVVVLLWLGCYPMLLGGPQLVPIQDVHWMAAAAALLALLPKLRGTPRVILRLPFVATLGALLSLGIALLSNSDDVPLAEMRWTALTGGAHALFFLAAYTATPSLDAGEAPARRAQHMLMLALCAMALGQGLVVVFDPSSDDPTWRPAGTLVNPNALGAMAGAIALAVAALGRWRPWVWLLSLPLLALLLATRSRGAAASLGLVVGVLAWRRFGWRALLMMAVVGALLVVVPNPLWDRIVALRPEHAFSRPFLWGRALEGMAGAPAGIGPGINRYVFPALAYDPAQHWLLHQRHTVGLTHNVLLTLGLEWGWLALASAGGLLTWTAASLWARRSPGVLRQAASLGALVLFVELQVDALEQNPIVFSLFLILAGTALARLPRPARTRPAVSGSLACAGVVLAAAALLAGAWRHHAVRSDVRSVDDMLVAQAAGTVDVESLREQMHQVVARWPGESAGWRRLLDFEERLLRDQLGDFSVAIRPEEFVADVARVRPIMAGALAANPRDVILARQVANILLLLHRRLERVGGQPMAETPLRDDWFESMQDLLRLDPLDVDARLALAREARAAGLPKLSRSHMEELLRLEPDYAWAWFIQARNFDVEGKPKRALYAWIRAREAVLNCRLHAQADNPRSRAFYERNLERVDLKTVQQRIVMLRRQLYF